MRVDLPPSVLLLAVDALRAQACIEQGLSMAPDLVLKEDTDFWKAADTIERVLGKRLTDAEKDAAARCMIQHGGGFAASLAEAWQRADSGNRERIESVFYDLFVQHVRAV